MGRFIYDGPLTASDLQVFAEALDVIEATPALEACKGIGRIEAVVDDVQSGWYERFDDTGDAGWGFTR